MSRCQVSHIPRFSKSRVGRRRHPTVPRGTPDPSPGRGSRAHRDSKRIDHNGPRGSLDRRAGSAQRRERGVDPPERAVDVGAPVARTTRAAVSSTREPTPPPPRKNRRRRSPTTSTGSPGASASTQPGGSHPATGTDVAWAPPGARTDSIASRSRIQRRAPPPGRSTTPTTTDTFRPWSGCPSASPRRPGSEGHADAPAHDFLPSAAARAARRRLEEAEPHVRAGLRHSQPARGARSAASANPGSARRIRSNSSRATARLPARSSRSASAYHERR